MPTTSLILMLRRDLARCPPLAHWLIFRCLPALVMVAMWLLLLAPAGAQAATAAADPGSGELRLREAGGAYSPAVLQRSRARLNVAGLIATVTIEQSFHNSGDAWVEGVYAFPLPETAAVRRMEMLVGERRILGHIAEREQARKTYERARESGRRTSLVEQQRPNLFTTHVANIGPGEDITVVLEYVQDVDYSEGLFSLRLPTTITPRYMPGPLLPPADLTSRAVPGLTLPYHGWAFPTRAVPDADRISPLQLPRRGSDKHPLNPVAISVQLDAGMPLASVVSPYHEIALSRSGGVYAIDLVGGQAEMDRDFVLQWRPVTGSAPAAALFTERVGDQHYGLLMLLPPALEQVAEPPPRELVLVVDTSGSMGGVSIGQARASVDEALLQLRPQDRFNIIAFNHSHRALFRASVPASRHNLQRAREFVRHLDANGGTEMLSALRAALAPEETEDSTEQRQLLRQVIFVTDGAVGNESQLFEEIVLRLGNSRLFTVGIGSAPNSWFMRKAAEFGRGTFTYVADVNEVGEKMAALFRQLAHPAAVQLSAGWPAGVEAWPERLPDLYQGEPLTVAVRFGAQLPQGELVVAGEVAGRAWSRSLALPVDADAGGSTRHSGVASIWARRKVASLLDERHRGKSAEAVRDAVLPVALAHSLLSPYTSFVAVEERVSRPRAADTRSQPVPNTRPRGQSPQPYAYPVTATTAPAKLWLGALLLLGVIVTRALRQEDGDA